jgi:hypothetical protein
MKTSLFVATVEQTTQLHFVVKMHDFLILKWVVYVKATVL